MTKAIMLSIQPKYCELIANGKKTIEVRKTAPKLETPFKCYMYCTKDAKKHYYIDEYDDRQVELIPTKIIGEFVCNKVWKIEFHDNGGRKEYRTINGAFGDSLFYGDCGLTFSDIDTYLQKKTGFGLHISDLKIYDKPRELGEFKNVKVIRGYHKKDESRFEKLSHSKRVQVNYLTRPPQSWGYVEEV